MKMDKATFKGNKSDVEAIRNSFRNFNKWETYGLCFNALESGGVTVGDIAVIAWIEAKIPATVIKMRMADFEKMAERI
jgi:hypothetical protein